MDTDRQIKTGQNEGALPEQALTERKRSLRSSIIGRACSWVRGVKAGLNLYGKYRVGIVIGDQRTKFVIVELTSEGGILRDSEEIVHKEREQCEVIEELIEILVGRIREIVGRWSCRDVPVHLAISGKKVLVKKIIMPSMSYREVGRALQLRFENELPTLQGNMVVGYRIGQESSEVDKVTHEVIATVTKSDHLEEMIAPFESAGFTDIRCLPAATIYSARKNIKTPRLLMDIEAKKTGVYVESEQAPYLYREIGIGADHFTEAITGRFSYDKGVLELNSEEAEELRNKYGILPDRIEADPDAQEAYLHIPDIMRPVVDKLSNEIKRTSDYVSSSMGFTPEEIVLTGGGSSLPGLVPYMRTRLGESVKLADFEHYNVTTDENTREIVPAHLLGFALAASMWRGGPGALIPSSYKMRRILYLEKKLFTYAAAILAGFILCYSTLTRDIFTKYSVDTALVNYSALMATSLGSSARELSDQKRKLEQLEKTLTVELPEGPDVVTILREMSHIVPAYVVLTSLEVIPGDSLDAGEIAEENTNDRLKGTKVIIGGVVSAQPLFLEVYLSKFDRLLDRAGLFENTEVVWWERTKEKNSNRLYFSIVCEMGNL